VGRAFPRRRLPAGIARLPLNLTLLKSCDVCGVFWGAFTAREPKKFAEQVAELFAMLKAGKINPAFPRASRWKGVEKRSPCWKTGRRWARSW
jgi:NADPH:quinone reductase-like Zn-dependent oxidoreductase